VGSIPTTGTIYFNGLRAVLCRGTISCPVGQAMVLLHGATNDASAHYCVVLELKNDSSDKLMLGGGKTIYHVSAAFLFVSNKRDEVTNELKF